MRVELRRQEVVDALIGPKGAEEMRLARITGAELRKDPAWLQDSIKAQGFFPGQRVVLLEGATDGLCDAVAAALDVWQEGDAQLVVTAGSLPARSRLRKLFEVHRNTFAIGVYNDPPGRHEVEAELKKAGLQDVEPDAMQDILALSRVLDPGDFRQTIEKLSIYKLGDETAVSCADVMACAPITTETGIDEVANAAAEGRPAEIGLLVSKLEGQGVSPVALCMGVMRHFRLLHVGASDPGGPGTGLARARPPVFGLRREKMVKQARHWGLAKLENALKILVETDLQLRSSARAPQMAVVERALIRLAMMRRR